MITLGEKVSNLKAIILIIQVMLIACGQNELSDDQRMEQAIKICQEALILDSHIDWPESVYNNPRDISIENPVGDFDIVRAEKGGLNAVFSVLYIDSHLNLQEGRVMFDSLYQIVGSYISDQAGKFARAFSPGELKQNFTRNLLSLPLCLENGSIIGDQLEYIQELKDLGITYITLCHNKSNQICDANMSSDRPWNGLSPFGEEVVEVLNRNGIIIDISHSSDSTVSDVLKRSSAPIVATHTGCRYFTPGYDRNLPDELIREIAGKEGVIMIAFGSMFLDPECSKNIEYLMSHFNSTGIDYASEEGMKIIQNYMKDHRLFAEADQVVDHIDHVVQIAGIDHVGLGSDFDGVGPTLPVGLPDVSGYPVIVAELLKRGYNNKELEKILGQNFLRVWQRVVDVAHSMNQ